MIAHHSAARVSAALDADYGSTASTMVANHRFEFFSALAM
jgi:hypothetical protein